MQGLANWLQMAQLKSIISYYRYKYQHKKCLNQRVKRFFVKVTWGFVSFD